jgi:hypothetical protein
MNAISRRGCGPLKSRSQATVNVGQGRKADPGELRSRFAMSGGIDNRVGAIGHYSGAVDDLVELCLRARFDKSLFFNMI